MARTAPRDCASLPVRTWRPRLPTWSYITTSTRQKAGGNEVPAHHSCTLVNLAALAIRLGRPLRWDPDKEQFIGDEQANRLVEVPMRSPWHL